MPYRLAGAVSNRRIPDEGGNNGSNTVTVRKQTTKVNNRWPPWRRYRHKKRENSGSGSSNSSSSTSTDTSNASISSSNTSYSVHNNNGGDNISKVTGAKGGGDHG